MASTKTWMFLTNLAFLMAVLFFIWLQQKTDDHCVTEKCKEPKQILQTFQAMKEINLGSKTKNLPNCALLYNNETLEELSEIYSKEKKAFLHYLKQVVQQVGKLAEGHCGQDKYVAQFKYYVHLLKEHNVKEICEIGFNAGHSAFLLLTASPHTKLRSFDIAAHPQTRRMAEYVRKQFPGRFDITFGNSLVTVPVAGQYAQTKCDFIIVDGGHSYKVASGDLQNMRAMANPDGHVLLMDDYTRPGYKVLGTGKAWDEQRSKGNIVETYKCLFPKAVRPIGGFAVGYYKGLKLNN